MKMLAVCPTFNRVAMCSEMIASFKKTVIDQQHTAELILGLSKNDPALLDYFALSRREGIKVYVSEENSITKIINEIYEDNKDYDFFHITNDDVVYQTDNWHFIFIWPLAKTGPGISFGNDTIQKSALCTFPCISAEIVHAVGWLQCPRLHNLCGDLVWYQIGCMLQCLHYNDLVILEHRHFMNGKRAHDKPEYQAWFKGDVENYTRWERQDLKNDLKKIKGVLWQNSKSNYLAQTENLPPRN